MFQIEQISQEKEDLRRQWDGVAMVSGRVGSIVGRIYPVHKNGKIIYQQRFASRPKQYKTNRRKDLQDNRFRFRTTALFGKEIITHPQLKKLWAIAAKGKSTAYNYINKVNYPLTSPEAPSDKNQIIPFNKQLQVENHKITPYAITGNLPYKKNSSVIALISFSEPVRESQEKFKLLSVSLPLTAAGFIIPVTTQIKQFACSYTKFTMFITVVTETATDTIAAGTFTTSGNSNLFILIPTKAAKPEHTINQHIKSSAILYPKAINSGLIVSLINNHIPRGSPYNILGKEIRTLINETKPPGEYTALLRI